MIFLSDYDDAVRAIADVEAFGVITPAADDRVQLYTRHRAGTAAHLLPRGELPEVLRPPLVAVTTVTPLSSRIDPAHAMAERLAMYGVEYLLLVPMPAAGGGGVLWLGKRGADAFTAEQVAPFEQVAATLAAADRTEPRDLRLARLGRIDAVDRILPLIAGSLDVRDVFHRISEVARTVVAHDGATITLLEEDLAHARLYALDGMTSDGVPQTFATNYAPVFNQHFQYAIHDDLLASPNERDRPTAKAGLRSALRVPLRFNGRVGGTIEFSSLVVQKYQEADVPVARRIADCVALALSHQRMAEEARRAAALKERSQNLMALDDLLATLTDVLDIREVIDRVSVIAKKVLTHDAMGVTSVLEPERLIRVHAISGFGDDVPASYEAPLPEPALLTEPWDHRIIEDMAADPRYANSPTVKAGMRSVLGLPVRVEGKLRGGINFYSRSKAAFTRDHVLVARRISDHVALVLSHQRLAEEARASAELKARAANLELLDDLLAALTDTEELTEVFDRLSATAKKVIPHDAMMLPVLLPDRVHAQLYASAGIDRTGLPEVVPVPDAFRDPKWEYQLVVDGATDPQLYNQRMAGRGFRSALRVPIRIDGKWVAGLALMAREPGVYKPGDVATVRRIADRFALCLARERQAEASRRADEASARANRLASRVRELSDELDARTGYRRVVGESGSWQQVLTQAAQVASTDTTVLLLGESGTGKEVVARFLHRASPRSDGPFIALNCAALPEHLLEAELFGYERGAFTGAMQSKPGQLEQAGGGTLFLDEVGEMAPPAQAKFLRVLQEREFQRLGGTRVLRTDARVVAATNRDLQQAMSHGQFREDLFYRLNVFAIHLPPLRERKDDVLPLSEAFLAEYGRSLGRPPSGISRDARTRLLEYHWPGNVRELRNILERAAILCDGGLITAEHLAINVAAPPAPRAPAAPPVRETLVAAAAPPTAATPPPAGDLHSMERAMIEQALQTARFNKSKAAAALGLTRAQLYVRMRKHGLE
jgi:transcriptional regulator with GAF, ATPase, and Fis domain